MAFILYIDEIGQAVVDVLNAKLATPLGLKLCQQGGLSRLPAPKDLDPLLNALLVRFKAWRLRIGDLIQGSSVEYEFELIYLRRQADGEKTDREQNKQLSKLGAVWLNEKWQLTALDGLPGLEIESIVPEEADADSDVSAIFDLAETRVSASVIKLVVKTTATS